MIVSCEETVLGLLCRLEQVCFCGTTLGRETGSERVEGHGAHAVAILIIRKHHIVTDSLLSLLLEHEELLRVRADQATFIKPTASPRCTSHFLGAVAAPLALILRSHGGGLRCCIQLQVPLGRSQPKVVLLEQTRVRFRDFVLADLVLVVVLVRAQRQALIIRDLGPDL